MNDTFSIRPFIPATYLRNEIKIFSTMNWENVDRRVSIFDFIVVLDFYELSLKKKMSDSFVTTMGMEHWIKGVCLSCSSHTEAEIMVERLVETYNAELYAQYIQSIGGPFTEDAIQELTFAFIRNGQQNKELMEV